MTTLLTALSALRALVLVSHIARYDGRGEQMQLFGLDRPDHLAADIDGIGAYRAFYPALYADEKSGHRDIADDRAIDMQFGLAREVARDRQAVAHQRRHLERFPAAVVVRSGHRVTPVGVSLFAEHSRPP